jgi:hypothetical protein
MRPDEIGASLDGPKNSVGVYWTAHKKDLKSAGNENRPSRRHEPLRFGNDADDFLSLAEFLEIYNPVNFREQGVVSTEADVRSRLKPCAALAHKDAPGRNHFTAETLHSKTLCIAIPAVAGTANSLFVSHISGSYF